MREDEEIFEEEWEEDETSVLPVEEHPSLLTRAMSHPRMALGGGSLLLSLGVDVAIRFDPFVMVLGLATAVAIGWNGDALARGMQSLIPGLDQQQVQQEADRFADQLLLDYPMHPDQRPIAKIRRLFRIEESDGVDESPLPKRGKAKNHQTQDEGEGFTFERIATWFEDGLINDKQFFVLLQRIDDEAERSQKSDGESGESVKRLQRPSEDSESQVKANALSPELSPLSPTVSPEEEESVLQAYFTLARQKGKVTREDIKTALQLNNKKHYIVKVVCDKYGIAMPGGK